MLKQFYKSKWAYIGLAVLMAFIVLAIWMFNRANPVRYSAYTSDSISYDKGTVTRVLSEKLEPVQGETGRYLGTQRLTVKMNDGTFKGKELTIQNDLSATHNIFCRAGQRVVVKVDHPKNATAYFTLYNYDRTPGIVLIVVVFVAGMALVGKSKGIKSVIGLAFTLFFILAFLLPMIFHGYSPVWSCVLTVAVTTAVSMVLLNGFGRKTAVAVGSTIVGVLFAALFFSVFARVMHLTGYNLEEAEELILVHQSTGLQVSQLLFVGVLIASLGAVMDMTMSVASSLYEITRVHPGMTRGAVFRSGMSIGQDMIGTMCETLILAFVGTAMTTLLVVLSYGTQLDQLLSSDYIAIEIVHSITGGMAVILAVPITTCLSALFFAPSKPSGFTTKEGEHHEIHSIR